ncbi:MAG: hypothetical protein VYC91_04650 [Acidobacteriota bacterium]|nr:hypothetical protein [Acidobacteriota bacterium]
MKTPKMFIGFALLFVAFTTFGMSADEESWTGWIADENCASDYTKSATADHAACAKSCLVRGGEVALSTEDGPFLLDFSAVQGDEQTDEQADEHIGHEVVIKGELDPTTNTIKVSSVSAHGHGH